MPFLPHDQVYATNIRIFEQTQEELEQTDADEREAQEAIQEGIEKAEKEEKLVTDEIAQSYKAGTWLSDKKIKKWLIFVSNYLHGFRP